MLAEPSTLRFAPPVAPVKPLRALPTGHAAGMYEQLRGVAECSLRQGWRDQPEPRFRPATVRVARYQLDLVVAAELVDEDIFNPVAEFNAPAFPYGDVFEIFVRPESQEVYYELHVSPRNQLFQLRIPSSAHFRMARGMSCLEPWKIGKPIVRSQVHIDAQAGRWWVVALVPLSIAEDGQPVDGTRWQFSFCRYDYTRGQPEPVLSSTSPHIRPDFHRQSEWGWLQF